MDGLDTITEIYLLMKIYDTHGYSETNIDRLVATRRQVMDRHRRLPYQVLREQESALLERVATLTFKQPSQEAIRSLNNLAEVGFAERKSTKLLEDQDSGESEVDEVEYTLTKRGIAIAAQLDQFRGKSASHLINLYEKSRNSK